MQFSLQGSTLVLALASAATAQVGLIAWDRPNYQGRNAAYNHEGNFNLGFFADR